MIKKRSWFSRLKDGLSRTSDKITQGISDILVKRKLDDAVLEELEELLITTDIGVESAVQIVESLRKSRFDKEVTDEEVRQHLAQEITQILEPVAVPLDVESGHKPHIVLVVGVNGTGKTTTIGKLAKQFSEAGKSVMMAAGDTFRAAAIEQLAVWGERVGCEVVTKDQGADPAALAYDAVERAKMAGVDVLLIDTAGRLHNKGDLMEELAKVVRVIKKHDSFAPHDTVLVLDATTGQNAHAQVQTFQKMVDVTGLILTKLDGTAKGGVLVALAQKFGLPVHEIGVGESADDLQSFKAQDFANSLMGVTEEG